MTRPPRNGATTDENPPLRLWPGVVIVALQWLGRFVVPFFFPATLPYGVLGGLVLGLALMVWWVFFSRAPRVERFGALVVIVLALVATRPLLHESIVTGMMGMMFVIYAVPVVCLAFVAWAALGRRLDAGPRRVAMVAMVFLACASFSLVRTEGLTASADSDFEWRWAKSAEQRLLDAEEAPVGTASMVAPAADWPGFRGPARDGVIPGVRLETEWDASPPVELWRRPVGPGWSSFAVAGDYFFTQEQRGEDEVVSCYDATSGEPIWRHADPVRFWESNAGAGPRGTPAVAEGRVYSLGATGLLNALDATDGSAVWSRDAAAEAGTELPMWGYSASPLVVDDLVVVAVSGALLAYEKDTGEVRWTGPKGGPSYSSPHLATLEGKPQILQLHGDGLVSVEPGDGTVLWRHEWSGYPIVQPAVMPGGDVLISVTDRDGLRRLEVTSDADGWRARERWTSIRLKPYFNDFVIHEGHAYGIEGGILAAVELEQGQRAWKGGRYGGGQLVLLPDQDLLLVLSEGGDLVLVEAKPDGFREVAKVPALDGKTWNHPVLVGDRLLVRNDQEMAAFRLPSAGS